VTTQPLSDALVLFGATGDLAPKSISLPGPRVNPGRAPLAMRIDTRVF
jgi:hypothetical protein